MPAIKCPACGCRHLQAVTACHNCGHPFVAAPASDLPASTAENPPISSSENAAVSNKRILAKARSARARQEERDEDQAPVEQEGPSGTPRSTGVPQERQLVRAGGQQLAAWQSETELQLYGTTLDITLPDPLTSSRSVAIENAQIANESWKRDKLPWYFPRIRPAIAGVVMHIDTKEEIFSNPDILVALAMLLVEFLWILVNVQQERENDRIVMTTVRVQTFEGQLKDARLRGNMRGADLGLGDQVSLWGVKRRGVLFVRRGFNHTSHGVITTNAVNLLLPVVLAAGCFAALLVFAPSWFPAITHTFTDIFKIFTLIFQHTRTK